MEIINIATIGRADTHDGHAALCPSYSSLLNGHYVEWAGKRNEVETPKADRPFPSPLPYPPYSKELLGIFAVFRSLKQVAA
jgi:hypothetical protein